jgi:hypothetical protein
VGNASEYASGVKQVHGGFAVDLLHPIESQNDRPEKER